MPGSSCASPLARAQRTVVTSAVVREHYDAFSLIYRTFWGDHIHHGLFERGDESAAEATVRLLESCVQQLDLHSGARVLDAGCGHGGTAVFLAQRLGCQVLGLTLSSKQAQLARENAQRAGVDRHTSFVEADVACFEFPVSSFDCVWTMESSEHFFDKPRYFHNAARTLRPGGKLLLAAWTGSMRQPAVRAVAEAFLCPELWTAEEYVAQLDAAGLTVRHRQDLTGRVLHTWEICRDLAAVAAPVRKFLPRAVNDFADGIDVILDAYRTGDLAYTVVVAEKSAR